MLSPADIQHRIGKVTGTMLAKAVTGEHGGMAAAVLESLHGANPYADSPTLRMGTRLEPGMLDLAEEKLGPIKRHVRVGDDYVSIEVDGMVASSGETVDAKSSGVFWAPAAREWREGMPDYVYCQVQSQICWGGNDRGHVAAFLPDGERLIEVARDDALCTELRAVAEHMKTEYIDTGRVPEFDLDQSAPVLAIVKRLRRPTAIARRLTIKHREYLKAVRPYEDAKASLRTAEMVKDAWEARLRLMLQEYDAVELPDGRLVTLKTINGTRFDRKAFDAAHPGLYEQFVSPNPRQDLDIRHPKGGEDNG